MNRILVAFLFAPLIAFKSFATQELPTSDKISARDAFIDFLSENHYETRRESIFAKYRKHGDSGISRLQGVKLHFVLPFTQAEYYSVTAQYLKILIENNIPHKVAKTFAHYILLGGSQRGKGITIYPQKGKLKETIALLKKEFPQVSMLNAPRIESHVSSDTSVEGVKGLYWRYGRFLGPSSRYTVYVEKNGLLGKINAQNEFEPFGEHDAITFHWETDDFLLIPVRMSLHGMTIDMLFYIYHWLGTLPGARSPMDLMEIVEDKLRPRNAAIDDDRSGTVLAFPWQRLDPIHADQGSQDVEYSEIEKPRKRQKYISPKDAHELSDEMTEGTDDEAENEFEANLYQRARAFVQELAEQNNRLNKGPLIDKAMSQELGRVSSTVTPLTYSETFPAQQVTRFSAQIDRSSWVS